MTLGNFGKIWQQRIIDKLDDISALIMVLGNQEREIDYSLSDMQSTVKELLSSFFLVRKHSLHINFVESDELKEMYRDIKKQAWDIIKADTISTSKIQMFITDSCDLLEQIKSELDL